MKYKLEEQEGEKRRFRDDVNDMCNTCLTDFKKLKRGVINLHKIWILGETTESSKVEKDSIKAY